MNTTNNRKDIERLCRRLYILDDAVRERGERLRMHEIVRIIREELIDDE